VVTSPGDIVYRDTGVPNYLTRLGIGAVGDVLTVSGAGLPSWAAGGSGGFGQAVFTAQVTASAAPIPTSRTTGAPNPSAGDWFILNNTRVTWSTASPGTDPNGVFSPVGGNFTVPIGGAGTYDFDAVITFDSGTGVNAGAGIAGFPPDGRACRQAQIFSPTLGPPPGTALATVVRQVEGSNNNSTAVSISAHSVALADLDTVLIRVRHDRNAGNTVTIGTAVSIPSQTYFTGKRVR